MARFSRCGSDRRRNTETLELHHATSLSDTHWR
jgi:hypothetical protein